MSEIEYDICKVIKQYNEIGIDPTTKLIAKRIYRTDDDVRYHLNKLIKLKIIRKEKRKYYLLVKL